MRTKWKDRPRAHRWAIAGAFVGMAIGTAVVFQYAFHGTTLDRYLIMWRACSEAVPSDCYWRA